MRTSQLLITFYKDLNHLLYKKDFKCKYFAFTFKLETYIGMWEYIPNKNFSFNIYKIPSNWKLK